MLAVAGYGAGRFYDPVALFRFPPSVAVAPNDPRI